MKKTMSVLMVTMISFVFIGSAMAGRVKDRQVNQQKLIHQGIHSGELSGREVRVLEKEQRQVQRTKKRAWSDGVSTTKERAHIE